LDSYYGTHKNGDDDGYAQGVDPKVLDFDENLTKKNAHLIGLGKYFLKK
jgi:hypothetical protein